MEKIDFKYLMKSRNIEGEIYYCDCDRFFGIKLDINKRNEVHSALMEIVREREIHGKNKEKTYETILETNERDEMKKPSQGRGQLSTMPSMKFRPALTKVSQAKVNGQTDRGSTERPRGK